MSPIEPQAGEAAEQVFLLPGTLYCAAAPTVVATILGSCVAVCLWDSARRMGGMNHFVLPRATARDADERYGDFAIERLIERMTMLGSRVDNLRAKVFGGANVLPVGASALTVGRQNVDMAGELLGRHRIPVVARRVGGSSGLRIWLDTRSGGVAVRTIAPGPDGRSRTTHRSASC
jgi:chemotaxis protein CheD